MIRYRLSPRVEGPTAALCEHPALKRLAGFGGWKATQEANHTVLTRVNAVSRNDWGPWKPGLNGLDFSVPDPLPPFNAGDWIYTREELRRQGIPVRLCRGFDIPVAPAYLDGVEILLDGSLSTPVSDYGALVSSLDVRLGSGSIHPGDPDLVRFCHLAMASCLALTPEVIHAWRLLTTADQQRLFDAAVTLPKPEAGAPGSPSAAPASTPEE